MRASLARALALILMALHLPGAATQVVNGITIDEDLPQARRGTAYSHQLPISGGTAPYLVTRIGANTLPASIDIGPTGLVSGVVSCAQGNGNNRQDIRITDSSTPPRVADFTGSRGLAINVTAGPANTCVALTLAPTTLPDPVVGTAYSQTITASGGLGPYVFSISAGALPAGLTLNAATGTISGTPTTAGSFSFTVQARDAADSVGTQAFTGTVSSGVTVSPATLTSGAVGSAYSQTLSASGGSPPYTFAVTAGALPTGLTLAGATLSGTPSAQGTFNFTVTATANGGATGTRSYSVTIAAAIVVAPATLPNAVVGTPYSQIVSATGGNGATVLSLAGSLPAGLAFNPATGVVSGTPTTAQTANFSIVATDSAGATATRAYTVTVHPAIVVNPATAVNGTAGATYAQPFSATGGSGTYTFSHTGTLPTGLALNPATGALGGTPGAAGTFSFTIAATDALGAQGSRAYTVTIAAAIAVNPAALPDATVGGAYAQTITTTGGTPDVTLSIAGALPAGLSFTPATGVISGTPTAAGTANFTINATDSVGATASRAYSLLVQPAAPIVVNPATAPNTTVGVAYSQAFNASGGTGGLTFSSTGTLPTGLALNGATGVLSGTAGAAGTFSFTVVATDSLSATGSRAYTVTVNPAIVVSPASLPTWTAGAAYSQTITASGGTGSVSLSLGGSLPTGLTFNGVTGAITGTPTAPGTYHFSVTATDAVGASTLRNYAVTINAAPSVSPPTLPDGTVGSAYAQAVAASGGTGAFTFAITAGSLPAGLSLNNASGQITGTPTTSGPSSFTVTATDSVGATASRAYSVTINAGVGVNPASLPASTAGVPYAQTVSATGGNGSYAFAVTSGALPAGLSLNAASGAITGTPTGSGASSFTVTVTDGLGATGSRAYTVTINPPIALNPASLPTATAGGAYNQAITGTGGTGSLVYSVNAGALPPGLTLNAAGQLSGTPTAAGTYNFTVTATDTVGATGSRAYGLTVNAGIAVNPATLANGSVGAPYAQAIVAVGGNGGTTYAVSAGALPAGLSLNANTGQIGGTPTAAATASFTITATDNLGATGSRAYTVTIHAALVINPATLPDGTVGAAYAQTVTATGGSGAVTFAVTAGVLPAGLTLNPSTGAVAGTPTAAATSSFTVTATDSLGATAARAYTVTTMAGVAVNPATLPAAMLGAPYAQALSATGGSGSYAYAVTAGALPAGVTLNAATGALSGTPTAPGTANFTITATSGGATGSRSYTVGVAAALAIGPATLPDANAGAVYNQVLAPAGGTEPYAFAISGGALPAGLSLDPATGAITGTPTSPATASFSITLTDGLGFTTTRSYAMTVTPPALTLAAGFAPGRVGSVYDQAIQVSGGTAPYAFSVVAGHVPPGLAISATTGALAGTPTASGTFTFTIRVVDAASASASFDQTVAIEARPDPTLEASVRGVNAAQIAAASRFGRAQLDNVASRLQMLHGGHDPCGIAIDIGTNARWERGERAGGAERGAAPQAAAPGASDEKTRSGCDRPFAVWAGGNVDFGFLRPHGAANRNDFTTSGVTLGVDARVMPDLVVGASLGYGRDRTDVDPSGSRSEGQAQSGSFYGSYRIGPSLFVDAQLGHARLDFDALRWSAPASALMRGDRNGAQSFGSFGVTGVVRIVGFTLAPYGRVDRVRSTLDGYVETGTAGVALQYGALTVNDDSILVGVRGSVDVPLQSVVVTPSLRLEQRRTRSRGADQSVMYADTPAVVYQLSHAGESRGFTTAGIGVLLRMGAVFTVDVEYTFTAGAGDVRSETARALLRAAF